MRRVRLPRSFFASILAAVVSLVLTILTAFTLVSPLIVTSIALGICIVAILASVFGYQESRRDQETQRRRLDAIDSSTGVGRTLSNLNRWRRLPV
jgi:hypothetical protein